MMGSPIPLKKTSFVLSGKLSRGAGIFLCENPVEKFTGLQRSGSVNHNSLLSVVIRGRILELPRVSRAIIISRTRVPILFIHIIISVVSHRIIIVARVP